MFHVLVDLHRIGQCNRNSCQSYLDSDFHCNEVCARVQFGAPGSGIGALQCTLAMFQKIVLNGIAQPTRFSEVANSCFLFTAGEPWMLFQSETGVFTLHNTFHEMLLTSARTFCGKTHRRAIQIRFQVRPLRGCRRNLDCRATRHAVQSSCLAQMPNLAGARRNEETASAKQTCQCLESVKFGIRNFCPVVFPLCRGKRFLLANRPGRRLP